MYLRTVDHNRLDDPLSDHLESSGCRIVLSGPTVASYVGQEI